MVKGRLAIKCKQCGHIGMYSVMEPIEKHTCLKCGSTTDIEDNFRNLFINCECGCYVRFKTNLNEKMEDVHCPKCKQIVAVELIHNRKNDFGQYVSINTYRQKGWNK